MLYLFNPLSSSLNIIVIITDGYKEIFNPVKPARKCLTAPREVHLKRDFEELLKCDIVVVLDNWLQSEGAMLEVAIARALKMPILEVKNGKLVEAEVI